MPSVRRLENQSDVRRTLAGLYRKLEKDEVDPTKARVLTYILLSISQIIGDNELEQRVVQLEAALPQRLRRSA